jgi:uncharacterized protein
MRVLFDIVHPAHVHFYKHLYRRLMAEGNECLVLARDKEVTHALLEAEQIPYETYGRPSAGRAGQAAELLGRDRALWRMARGLKPDIVLCRNPAGVQVARLTRSIGVFDTDDGSSAGIHYKLAKPFAHVITTPSCLTEDFGPKHRPYPGYKALAFVHPNHFTPDETAARAALGVGTDDPYAIVRLTAMYASHDLGEQGLDLANARTLVAMLRERGRVFVSTETETPAEFAEFQIRIPAERMLDVLAFASVIVGDSGSMAGEAGALGTPNVFYGSFAGRREYLTDLEVRYQLGYKFRPEQAAEMIATVDTLTADPVEERARWQDRRAKMLAECVDVSDWYYELVNELVSAPAPRRR